MKKWFRAKLSCVVMILALASLLVFAKQRNMATGEPAGHRLWPRIVAEATRTDHAAFLFWRV